MVEYMQMAKTLKDKGFEGRASQWGEGWFAGMNGTLKDEKEMQLKFSHISFLLGDSTTF